MLYDIGLKISYDYELPANAGRHVLRLMPLSLPGEQRVVAGRLDIEPAAEERSERRDFFGNTAVEIAYRAPHEHIAFEVRCRVDREAPPPSVAATPLLSELPHVIAAQQSLDPSAPHHFLGRSQRVWPVPETTAYAFEQIKSDVPVRDAMVAVGEALHRNMRFDPEATTVDTPFAEAFAHRHGVCQDFVHIMIACLRGIGMPAGYVSGFLRTIPPEGKPRLSGADQMHAWVRTWCGPEAGWIEFDPTNNLFVQNDHIVVARGRDYADVAPVKGVLRTAGTQTTRQAVDVNPITPRRAT